MLPQRNEPIRRAPLIFFLLQRGKAQQLAQLSHFRVHLKLRDAVTMLPLYLMRKVAVEGSRRFDFTRFWRWGLMGMAHKGFDIHKEIKLTIEINIRIKAVLEVIKFIGIYDKKYW